jgi:hypothetical protein
MKSQKKSASSSVRRRTSAKSFRRLVERFRAARKPADRKKLGDQLGRLVFGE